MSIKQTDIFEAEILPLFEEYRGDWLAEARKVAVNIAMRDPQRRCDIEKVRRECPLPPGVNPNVLGAVFRGRKGGEWDLVGYKKSKRKSSHGRRVGVYYLRQAPRVEA